MKMLNQVDAEYLARQMSVGLTTSIEINDVGAKVDLTSAISGGGLALSLPSQVEVMAEGASCYLYQGGVDVLDSGWTWPAADKRYRLLANERRVINVLDGGTCLAAIRRDTSNGTLVITETRIR